MSRVAIVTCAGDDVDPDSPLLLNALAQEGLEGELVIWDHDVDWLSFDIVVIRSTWNYVERREQFLEWAKGINHLENPYQVIEYSTDKHYLADLAAKGVSIVPSHFCDVGQEPEFPEGDFVVKPCVGAGSLDAERYRTTNTIGRGAMSPPCMKRVATHSSSPTSSQSTWWASAR